jgi:hypothetical protein
MNRRDSFHRLRIFLLSTSIFQAEYDIKRGIKSQDIAGGKITQSQCSGVGSVGIGNGAQGVLREMIRLRLLACEPDAVAGKESIRRPFLSVLATPNALGKDKVRCQSCTLLTGFRMTGFRMTGFRMTGYDTYRETAELLDLGAQLLRET